MNQMKVGINGFGRIGRVLFRVGYERLNLVGINTLDSLDGLAHLLKYDSSHGQFAADVHTEGDKLVVNGRKLQVSAFKNPAEIPWKSWEADMVLECTGAFKKKDDYLSHLKAGAKKVMISAPAEEADLTVVYGVNHKNMIRRNTKSFRMLRVQRIAWHRLQRVLNETFGIENGTMLTVHSYTNDQRILDAPHKDLRRARTAAVSMIPTTTGAAKAVGLVLPMLKGKIDGLSIRVPTPNVSVVDFTFNSSKDMSVESINQAFTAAAKGELKGILGVEDKPLVSIDYNGNPLSSIVDLDSTMTVGPRMAKVLSWYDNESGFSNRMIDLALAMNSRGLT